MSVVDRTVTVARGQRERSSGKLMTVADAIDRFRDEWVLMKVTEKDEHHWPTKGYVLAHSRDETEVTTALAAEPMPEARPPDEQTPPYYVFNAYPRLRSGPEYVAAVGQFVTDFITRKAADDARKRR